MRRREEAARDEEDRRLLAAIRRRIRENVNAEKGIRNVTIERFCYAACDSETFRGVFAADCIPFKLQILPSFIIVINLGKVKNVPRTFARGVLPTGHFVAVAADRSRLYYFDPYGLKADVKEVNHFLKGCGRKIEYNRTRVQSWKSNYCGLYCILYVCYSDGTRAHKIGKKGLRFYSNQSEKKLLQNDRRCVDYLKQMFSL